MKRTDKTPRIGGETPRLKEPRGTGAWMVLALTLILSVAAVVFVFPDAETARARPAAAEPAQETLEVWLVRHAEKVDDSRDPELSEAGHARAELLAELLAGEGIQRVHSTDYLRTRHTAEPLARRLGVEVELYDPSELVGFASELHSVGGTHLVVGHSNTTPGLVEALGGDPVSPIDEAEYDRLYRVWLDDDGTVESELRRFGAAFEEGPQD